MKNSLIAIAILCFYASGHAIAYRPGMNAMQDRTAGLIDSGQFSVFAGGEKVGTEKFELLSDFTGHSTGELNINGSQVAFEIRVAYDAQGQKPIRFSIDQKPSTHIDFEIHGTEIKASGAINSTGTTEPNAVVLENNVWYQYWHLIHRYDRGKGGIQTFSALVPSIMQTVPATLELMRPSSTGGTLLQLNIFQLKAGPQTVHIAADVSGKLVYISVPSAKAEAVRDERVEQLKDLRATVATATGSAISAGRSARPDYSTPAGAPFTAEEVTIPVSSYKLAGTLLIPGICARKKCPAVVMITGSGQQTRDESIAIKGLEEYRPFKQIAEAIAAEGMAVLRVDDRGVGESTGRETLATATTSDFARDTIAQVGFLRGRKEIDENRIALIGHSEGGVIAPMIAAADPRIAAVVLMAGPGKKGSEISYFQVKQALAENTTLTEQQKESQLALQREITDAVQNGKDLSNYPASVRIPWVKEFFTYDPIPTIRKVKQPILILQGGLDQQITPDQAGLLEAAAKESGNLNIRVQLFPNLNHLFLPAKTGAFSEYGTLQTKSIPSEVIRTLTGWLKEKLRP
jgi:pimeloyl-ACP methyl ester carboxylesterase